MSDNRIVAKHLLMEAADTILNRRPGVHGSAENSFAMIGEMWSVFLRHNRVVRGNDVIRPEDVAHMMVMLKQARITYGSTNRDNPVDIIGYSALAGMLMLPDPEQEKGVEQELNKSFNPAAERGRVIPADVLWDGKGFVTREGEPCSPDFHQAWLPYFDQFPTTELNADAA